MKRSWLFCALLGGALLALAACAPISPDFVESASAPVGGPASASASAAAATGDLSVTLDGGISGTAHLPQGAGPFPTVLLLHGFGSYKDEVGNMYKDLAAALGEAGIASLRIDFRGFGKSDGDTGATTVGGQVEDAVTAYNWLTEQEWVDSERIGVQGFSLGGAVASIVAAEHPAWFKSLTTWSSSGDLVKDFADLNEARAIAEERGIVGIDLGWRTIVLKKEFFDSLAQYNVRDAVLSFPGAYFTIAGEEDFSAEYAPDFAQNAIASPSQVWIVPGGDHIYQVLSGDNTMANSVIDATVTWYEEVLQ